MLLGDATASREAGRWCESGPPNPDERRDMAHRPQAHKRPRWITKGHIAALIRARKQHDRDAEDGELYNELPPVVLVSMRNGRGHWLLEHLSADARSVWCLCDLTDCSESLKQRLIVNKTQGFVIVGDDSNIEVFWGYVSLTELWKVTDPTGAPLEVDPTFNTIYSLADYMRKARDTGKFILHWEDDDD